MRLFTGLYTGRESIVSHSTALGATADNLANLNTPGFKATRAEFSDLLAEGSGGLFSPAFAPGNGSTIDTISSNMAPSSVESTERELDVAISGEGFFVLADAAGDTTNNLYTRAGNFSVDENGLLSTFDGLNVLGFTEESPDVLTTLSVRSIEGEPVASTAATYSGNLDVQSPIQDAPANPATFAELNQISNFSTPLTVVDSLGAEQEVFLHFTHTANLTWDVQAFVDGADVGGEAGVPVPLGQTELTFLANGTQAEGDAASTLAIEPAWGNGADAGNIAIDLSGFNSFATPSSVRSLTVDGIRAGDVSGVTIDNNGNIVAALTNGETQVLGSIGLAYFTNPNALDRIGSNTYLESFTSGTPDIGLPQTDTRGGLRGSALETSNVDQANEFVNIVRYQRGYQAGSKVISTHNELLEQTINIA